jgi:NAD(P)H-nitrite reductase large subunit
MDDIGTALRAGTNCGSCRPELKKIVNHGRGFCAIFDIALAEPDCRLSDKLRLETSSSLKRGLYQRR